jgi:hypothetical protein
MGVLEVANSPQEDAFHWVVFLLVYGIMVEVTLVAQGPRHLRDPTFETPWQSQDIQKPFSPLLLLRSASQPLLFE